MMRLIAAFVFAACFFYVPAQNNDKALVDNFTMFSDPAQIWGNGIESLIETAYRNCFKTFIINDKVVTLRIPFAQNNERSELVDMPLVVEGYGKAYPDQLWNIVDKIFDTPDFINYINVLRDGYEKVIIFDLQNQTWSAQYNFANIASIKSGAYTGLPHRPIVFASGNRINISDIYNYLFCVSRIGMDCSGFVYYILSTVAEYGGVNLNSLLIKALGLSDNTNASIYTGTAFFDSKNKAITQVNDNINLLKPCDVILFRGKDGIAVHSAIIQSIDMNNGIIRYLQSTDEAPLDERGVHESFIYFNPLYPNISLKDKSVLWSQQRFPAFPGETPSAFSNDGDRYRAYPDFGAGKIVRLDIISHMSLFQKSFTF